MLGEGGEGGGLHSAIKWIQFILNHYPGVSNLNHKFDIQLTQFLAREHQSEKEQNHILLEFLGPELEFGNWE